MKRQKPPMNNKKAISYYEWEVTSHILNPEATIGRPRLEWCTETSVLAVLRSWLTANQHDAEVVEKSIRKLE